MFLGVSRAMVVRLGWTTLGYGAVQVLRLISNVVMARLLAPPIFGLMAVVNTVRTGVELLSDVGILQNIVSNPRGADPRFYNTAWTIQAVRGMLLAACGLILSVPVARFFNHPELATILPVASLFFIFTGFCSTAHALLQKELQVARISIFEVGITFITMVTQIAIALITPTVWALVVGSIVSGASMLVASYLYIPGLRHRIMIDLDCAKQLLRFGKWVFFSSIVYFLAMNFDRLYFAKQISLSQLGVYGIARSLADMISLFVVRASSFVLYPTVAAAGLAPIDLRRKLLRGRRTLLSCAAIGMGGFIGLSNFIVHLLYDVRYHEAALILPIISIGVWFGILTSTNDSILMGISRPAYPALSNAAKLITYVVGVPISFYFYGFFGAIGVISGGEIVKYAVLWGLSHREHLRFGRDDLVLTLAMAATALLVAEISQMLGFGGGVQSLFDDVLRAAGAL